MGAIPHTSHSLHHFAVLLPLSLICCFFAYLRVLFPPSFHSFYLLWFSCGFSWSFHPPFISLIPFLRSYLSSAPFSSSFSLISLLSSYLLLTLHPSSQEDIGTNAFNFSLPPSITSFLSSPLP